MVCYSGLDDGFGKKTGVCYLGSACNNDYKIEFSVLWKKGAVIGKSLKVKYRRSVAYHLDELAITEDPCCAVIFVEGK